MEPDLERGSRVQPVRVKMRGIGNNRRIRLQDVARSRIEDVRIAAELVGGPVLPVGVRAVLFEDDGAPVEVVEDPPSAHHRLSRTAIPRIIDLPELHGPHVPILREPGRDRIHLAPPVGVLLPP